MLETAWEDRQLPDSKEITDTQRVSVIFCIQYKCLLSLTAPVVLPQQQAAAKAI